MLLTMYYILETMIIINIDHIRQYIYSNTNGTLITPVHISNHRSNNTNKTPNYILIFVVKYLYLHNMSYVYCKVHVFNSINLHLYYMVRI